MASAPAVVPHTEPAGPTGCGWKDFILVGEFCEIQGPVATAICPWNGVSKGAAPNEWMTKTVAEMAAAGRNAAAVEDSANALQVKIYERPREREFEKFEREIERCVREACNGLVMRTLTGDVAFDSKALTSSASVSIDALPWLSHSTSPHARMFRDYVHAAATVALTAVVVTIPDACARGFTRTLCFAYVSEEPLAGTWAAKVAVWLREQARAVEEYSLLVHPREVAQLHARLNYVISVIGSAESDDEVASSRLPTPNEDLHVRKKEALQHFWALPEHQRRRFREEALAIQRRHSVLEEKRMLESVGSLLTHKFASTDLVKRLLLKGSQQLRPLCELGGTACDGKALRITPDSCREFIQNNLTTFLQPAAYCALCRLPALVVLPPQVKHPQALETLLSVLCSVYGIAEEAVDQLNSELPPTLGDFENHSIIMWSPTASADRKIHTVAKSFPVALIHYAERKTCEVSVPEAWSVSHAGSSPGSFQLPPSSLIPAVLDKRVVDREQVKSGMAQLRAYIGARVKQACAFEQDITLILCSPEPSAWPSVFELPRVVDSQMDRDPRDRRDVRERRENNAPPWLINCLRARAAQQLLEMHAGELLVVPPYRPPAAKPRH